MKKTRILIADDHLVVRMGIAAVLGFEKDMAVVGEAENGREAAEFCRAHPVDVVILDLRMPEMDGATAAAIIHREHPEVKMVLLTTFEDSIDIQRALDAGVTGAVLKNSTEGELVGAIRAVLHNEPAVSKEIARQLRMDPAPPPLTQKQLAVLESVARGLSNQEIAIQFGISPSGVKVHLAAIFEKLGVANRTEAAAAAQRYHLFSITPPGT